MKDTKREIKEINWKFYTEIDIKGLALEELREIITNRQEEEEYTLSACTCPKWFHCKYCNDRW